VPDWRAEGLLDGLGEDEARDRADLLDRLHGAGVGLDELREAVAEDRLALVPLDVVLSEEGKYTADEIAELSGLPPDVFAAQTRAIGLPVPDPETARFGERDLEAARRLAAFRDLGMPEDEMLEVSRVLGESMARLAESMRTTFGQAFLRAGDSERDLGMRYAEAAREALPLLGPMLEQVLSLHLREQVRSEIIGAAQRESGRLPGAQQVSVAFADLVDFTRLGESVPADELGAVARRLGALTTELVEPPVRLVKTIGDAVMLVSTEPGPLVQSALDLVSAAEEQGEAFPQLRAGVAAGSALNRAGDWYGQPVNLASRVTGVAWPGTVLVTRDVRDATRDAFAFSRRKEYRLKGVGDAVPVYAARPRAPDGDDA
jgi:adenylate cyclase